MDKNYARVWLGKKEKKEVSHLIFVIDRNDGEFDNRFVKRGENIEKVLFEIVCHPNYEILEIYNYDMDLEQQLAQRRTYNINAPYNKMNEALEFAKERHQGQMRKNGSPYINHPITTGQLVDYYFSAHPRKNELKTASYLHDTVEDTETTIEEIRERFGEHVAHLVSGVTSDETLKHLMGKMNYLCYEMQQMDEETFNLKLCDRLANVIDLENAPRDFQDGYIVETIMIQAYLLNNRKMTNIQRRILEDINQIINELRKTKILKLIEDARKITNG